jgi:hypothetical protein
MDFMQHGTAMDFAAFIYVYLVISSRTRAWGGERGDF